MEGGGGEIRGYAEQRLSYGGGGYCLCFLLSKKIKSMNSFIRLIQKKQKIKNIVIT